MITAFDASFCSRPDGTSQGGYFVLLAPKHVLETQEDVYHILDWKSFKLPRVARSSLSAEAQSAGCAADATEFACRYYEHLLQPDVPLATLLNLKSSLAPTLVTDAKALFDSYHRESLVSNVTDRRSSLEIRVVKEQISGLGGGLRWVSSDRQLADGMTKDSMRQQLADKLRHGRIKFLYDPNYVAAKKKTLEEKKQELESTTKSRNTKRKKPQSELRIIKEELEASEDVEMIENDLAPTNALVSDFEQVPTNDLTPKNAQFPKNDMVTQYAKVPAETYFAQSADPIEYVDMVQNALTPLAMDAPAARCWLKKVFKLVMVIWWLMKLPGASAAPMAMCLTEHEEVKTESSKSWESIFLVLAILALCCAGIYVWRLRADQVRPQRRIDDLEVETQHGNHRANVLVVMYDGLRESFDRRTTAYDRARRAFVEQRAAAQELQGALALATQDLGAGYQAQMDVRQHVRRCPLGDEIHIQDGSSVWHRDDECDELYNSGREIRIFQPCAVCSRQDLVVPGEDAMQFFDEHGVRVVNAPPGMQFT